MIKFAVFFFGFYSFSAQAGFGPEYESTCVAKDKKVIVKAILHGPGDPDAEKVNAVQDMVSKHCKNKNGKLIEDSQVAITGPETAFNGRPVVKYDFTINCAEGLENCNYDVSRREIRSSPFSTAGK